MEPVYYVQEICPGDLIVHRTQKTVERHKDGTEIVVPVETHFLVLSLEDSSMLKHSKHVLCLNLTTNNKDIPFSLNFGHVNLNNAYEWTLYRDGKGFAFREDYGHP